MYNILLEKDLKNAQILMVFGGFERAKKKKDELAESTFSFCLKI
jgi:hypothetical protein